MDRLPSISLSSVDISWNWKKFQEALVAMNLLGQIYSKRFFNLYLLHCCNAEWTWILNAKSVLYIAGMWVITWEMAMQIMENNSFFLLVLGQTIFYFTLSSILDFSDNLKSVFPIFLNYYYNYHPVFLWGMRRLLGHSQERRKISNYVFIN